MCASTFENLKTPSYYLVVYACPNTNRLVCENGGNCYTDTGHEDGYLDESTLVDDGSGYF